MTTVERHYDPQVAAEQALLLLEQEDEAALRKFLQELHPSELVSLVNSVDPVIQPNLLQRVTGLDVLSEFLSHTDTSMRELTLHLLDDSRVAAVIRRQDIDDAADVLALLPRRRQVRVLRRLSAKLVKELTALLAYDKKTAGGLMNPFFLSYSSTLSCNEVLSDLRMGLKDEDIGDEFDLSYLYFFNESELLIGVCSLRELLAAGADASISDIIQTDVISVLPDDDQEVVARKIADYDLTAIPVIDQETFRMLGIITIDDIIDVIEEEATEDLLKLAGTEDQDTVSASIPVAMKSRLPWLLASWGGGLCGALLLGQYQSTLEKIVALAFFMPVVFGMGGNVGSQSSTITVRGLATGALAHSRMRTRVRKELFVGLGLGGTFGMLLGVAAFLIYNDLRLAGIVGLSIMATMTFASALGAALPVIFKRLGIDPAVASGPLVTTTTDIMSITIYFTIATLLL